jgi:hypothetical protein
MTALTLIVDGEPTAIGRPLGSRTVQTRPLTATRRDMNFSSSSMRVTSGW